MVVAPFRRKAGKGALAGPRFVVPVLGCIVEMVLDPFGFWERQRECVPPCSPAAHGVGVGNPTFSRAALHCLHVLAPTLLLDLGSQVPEPGHDVQQHLGQVHGHGNGH